MKEITILGLIKVVHRRKHHPFTCFIKEVFILGICVYRSTLR